MKELKESSKIEGHWTKRRDIHKQYGDDKGQTMEKFRCSHVHKGKSFSHFNKIMIQSTLGLKQSPRMAVMRSDKTIRLRQRRRPVLFSH